MGLFNFGSEFIDIVEWIDDSTDTIAYRFSRHDNEIKNNAALIVRESQVAVFVDQGKFADVFQPGKYTLNTENLPILSTLRGWKYGFNSPFKAEVYFISTKTFRDQLWGTPAPITKRDPEFGLMQLRAFGNYTFRVTDPIKLLTQVVGTNGLFTVDNIKGQLQNFVITRFSDVLAEYQMPAIDLATQLNELSVYCNEAINKSFEEYGIEIKNFLISNINFPEEINAAIGKRVSMNVLGNLNQFTQYQTGKAVEDAANNPSGGASAAVGMGMGVLFTNQMGNAQANPAQAAGAPPPVPAQTQYFLVVNNEQAGPYTISQIKQMADAKTISKDNLAWKEGMVDWVTIESFQELKALIGATPPPLPQVPKI